MIREIISKGESKTVEFKTKLPNGNQIARTVCSFANRAGGHLLVGVSDTGEIIGLEDDEINLYMEKLPNIINDSVYPMILPEIYTYVSKGRKILVIRIYPGSMLPYYLKSKGKINGTYVRVGRTNKQADNEMIAELERLRVNKSFDEDVFCELYESDRINLISILNEQFQLHVDDAKLENLKLISKQGDISYLSNAGAVILGKFSYSQIKCGRFIEDSVIDFIDKKEFKGTIFEILEKTMIFLKDHLHLSGKIEGQGIKRRETLEIPEEILREGIVNAVLHRDYSISGSDIKVAVFDSKIEITSPGGLPKSLSVEEIYAGRSEIRNKVLSGVFVKAGLTEQWGTGIPRMRELASKVGLREPKIEEKGLYITLTIYRNNRSFENRIRQTNEIKISKAKQIAYDKEKVIEMLNDKKNMTLKEIAEVLNVSETTAQRRLQDLQNENRIRRIGSRKTGYWILADK